MRLLNRLVLLGSLLVLAGCRSMVPTDFEQNTPQFDPMTFFEGRTESWGVIENRRGNPTSQLRAELQGTREGDILAIEQRFTFSDGRRETRKWRIRRIDAHHFEATANDVVGISRGEARGNVFRWSYTTEGKRAWFVDDLDFSLWMYLMDDGKTLINRVTVSKFGVVVARTTERFTRTD